MKTLRETVRIVLEDMISEAVTLGPKQVQVKAQISKLSPGIGAKAGVLFSRMMARRIESEEAEQMADEVRSTIAAAGGAGGRGLQQAFEEAYAELEDGLGIGDMISGTLKAAAPVKPGDSFTMRSALKKA